MNKFLNLLLLSIYLGVSLSASAPLALKGMREQAAQELREDILPFWLKHARNEDGFIGELSEDLRVRPGVPRGALLRSRILWTFSAAYRRERDPRYLLLAQEAYRDLEAKFLDKDSGGYFWSIDAKDEPLDMRKQIYGQSFAIYAMAEYYRATGSRPALDRAIEVYKLIEKFSHDTQYGGYLEVFSRDWTRPEGIRLNVMGPQLPKSQNTHLHLMEAYTNLLRVWPDEGLRENQRQLIEVMLGKVLRRDGRHLDLFFDKDWTPRSDQVSYGHDIEASWLLPEAAEVLGNAELQARTKIAALKLATSVLEEGQDADGGLFHSGGSAGVLNTDKEWWPQAEAAVGFVNAYELSHDIRYAVAARKSWTFIQRHQIDHVHGEWFECVKRDGTPSPGRQKLGFWKCPYHNGRACMELMERLARD